MPAARAVSGFDRLRDELVAPPLMWSESRSVLHRAVWRGLLPREDAEVALTRLEGAPVRPENPKDLGRTTWRLADELNWAKTYDAEYLALARLLGAPLLSLDARMRRAAERLGIRTADV